LDSTELGNLIDLWDGDDTQYLKDLTTDFLDESGFVDSTIELMSNERYSIAATWLLKRAVESKYELNHQQSDRFFAQTVELEDWEAVLHLFQAMSYIQILDKWRQAIESKARHGLSDPNKFVRAWSYSVLFELARKYDDLQDEVQGFFDKALLDEAPAVKARIRNCLKKGF
jgi:hypothetical protein